MGLGTPKMAWQRQVKRFGHDQASKYSCLIFDNRGMGGSDKPLLRYSTSEMAKDVFDLLDQLRWTSKRQLHLIGVSMGGMIVQEMVGADAVDLDIFVNGRRRISSRKGLLHYRSSLRHLALLIRW